MRPFLCSDVYRLPVRRQRGHVVERQILLGVGGGRHRVGEGDAL